MLVCTPPAHRAAPTPRGFTVEDGEWRCDVARFEGFLAEVGGVDDPITCANDCYVAGTRIEGFIAQRKADGEWTPALTDAYPDVESLAEIAALALFFRTCQADHEREAATIPGDPSA